MDVSAIKAMMSEIAPVIRDYVGTEITPLLAENKALAERITELEGCAAPLTVEEVRAVALAAIQSTVKAPPEPEPMPDVAALAKAAAAEQVAALAATLPMPEKGESGPQGERGPAGEVDLDAVKALIEAAVAARPPAERGERGERGHDGLPGERGADGLPGADGKDGVGLADALIDKDGHLVLTMTDGRTKNLGPVHGQDGAPGKDGADGLGFEHMNVEQVNERTLRFLFKRDADEAEVDVTFPVPIYRGVFKEGGEYQTGDLTTWGGSLWHCNEPKGLKPGAPDSGWQLAAKAGRPGKDAGK